MNKNTSKILRTALLTCAIAIGFSLPTQSAALAEKVSQSNQLESLKKEVYIEDFAYAGSGCPVNSVAYLLSNDRKTLEILFDKFQVNLQPKEMGQALYPPQANCSLSIKLHVPPKVRAAWHRVEHRGFADTSGGARGQIRAKYYIPAEGGFDTLRISNIAPNTVKDYLIVDDEISSNYTPAGRIVPMTVSTRIRLEGNPTKYNALTVDSISKKVSTKLFFNYMLEE